MDCVYRHYSDGSVDTMVDLERGTAEVGTGESRGGVGSDEDVPLHFHVEVSDLSPIAGDSMDVPRTAEEHGHEPGGDLEQAPRRSQLSGGLGVVLPAPQGPPSDRMGESPKCAMLVERS